MLLEERWPRFTPTGRTLCLQRLGYKGQPTLYQVRNHLLCTHWSPAHLADVCNFLESKYTETMYLIPADTLRTTLYLDYKRLRNLNHKHKELLAGFLVPPIDIQRLDPDAVVSIMLLGKGALCQSGEALTTFQEFLNLYKMKETIVV